MKNMLDGVEDVLLMGPGPSYVSEEVYQALRKPTLGHLDPYFIELMDEIKRLQQQLMQTGNTLTFPVSGTGSAGMEAVFVNLIEKGDPVLILINGVFGTRMKDVAERLGGDVDALEFTWGTPVDVHQVQEQLKKKDYRIVAVVHAETSTGVRNPVDEIAGLLSGSGTFFIVDTVTSLGGIPVKADEWGADAVYSGSQKCLSVPPGLSPVTFSDRAVEKIKNRSSKVPNWYLDMSMIANYWSGTGKKRAYHHTAPINMLYALYRSLQMIVEEEGMEKAFERHRKAHEQLVTGVEELGLEMLVDKDYRLPMLNSIKIPDGADDAAVRSALRNEHKIEIGAGLGPLAGRIWRVGVMGHTARPQYVDRFLKALKAVL
jgi:alanine-glyoxylate transaminase/serine-glyoxylate transaminase/serine-pyruvate transaminase